MKKFLKAIKSVFTIGSSNWQRDLAEQYLAESKTLAEVERRQRQLENGTAWFQKMQRTNDI